MKLSESLLPEFDHEMALTRQVLARVPEAAFDWRPHELSFTMRALACHLARIPHWGTSILRRDAHDLAAPTTPRELASSLAEILDAFDHNVADVRRMLMDTSDGELLAPWVLTRGKDVLMSMPRLTALRRFLLYHVVHHRGQLTVYLRIHHVPLPPIYGPSANETW
jgi:uncharacterized damage-inducible protein DinB